MRSLLKYKFCRYPTRSGYTTCSGYTTRSNYASRICFLLLFVFSINSNAQSAYTDPSTTDLRLAQSAVSSCDILKEVTQTPANSLSSQEFFEKLQKTDSNGNLLIDTEGCTESILRFVSSLCSSDSNTNRSFCRSLGFTNVDSKSAEGSRNNSDYKSYGESALRGIELGTSNVQAQNLNNPTLANDKASTFSVTSGVSVAGLLFSFTPIKRLKLARNLLRSNSGYTARVVTSRIKPVLSGAMLILATLGLSSCSEITKPETPCTKGENGYFELQSSNGTDCIKLVAVPTISYLDSEGNVVTNTNDISDHSIKVTFEEPASFIDTTVHGNLTTENVVKMVDIKLGNIDLLDVGFSFTIEIESDQTSFTLTPETNYSAGDYIVSVSHYAKTSDISKIVSSTNRAEYISTINSMSRSISSFSVHTPCSRGEEGYFELTNPNGLTDCIKLAVPTISYIDEDGNVVEDTTTITNHSIRVAFEGESVSFITETEQSDLLEENILEMMQIKLGEIDLIDVGFGFTVEIEGDQTSFTLTPETNYSAGDYIVSVSHYAKTSDISKIVASTNRAEYISTVNSMSRSISSFSVHTPCSRGEEGYFELTNSNGLTDCIKLAVPTVSYIDEDGNVVEDTTTITNHSIRVAFEESVSFITETEQSDLLEENILEMMEIKLGDIDLLDVGFSFTIEIEGDQTSFTLTPQTNYSAGSYIVSVSNYAKTSDISKITASTNRAEYISTVNSMSRSISSFSVHTPCSRGEEGYFELQNSNGLTDCIKLAVPTVSYIDEAGNVVDDTSTITNHSIRVAFEGEPVSFITETEQSDLSEENILEMMEIKLGEIDLIDVGFAFNIEIEGDQTSFTLTPQRNYSAGDYIVSVSNYAKKADVSKIVASTNRAEYISTVNSMSRSISSFSVHTPCSRGEEGYFELTNSNGLTDCIKLAVPTISYIDEDGNVVDDTTTITNHSIRVAFDGRVSYIDSDRYEGLTAAFARNMIELNKGGTNLLTSTFRFSIEVGIKDENSFFILTPISSYPTGSYSVKIKNYVNSLDVLKVVSAPNKEDYLVLINKEYSSFSTPDISTLCKENAPGYFELTYDDGSKECIRIPNMVFTFTPRGGREMIESNFDPTLVIKIYFDSEVMYLEESGEWRGITKEDILEMIEISRKFKYGGWVDHVSMDGAIGLDLVSVSHVGGETVITIKSPYDHTNEDGRIYGFHVPYNVIVTNFAKKSDVSKIASSNSISSYLEDTTTFYQGAHSGLYKSTSCDLGYAPQSDANYDQYDDAELDNFICETNEMMDTFLPPSGDTAFDMAMDEDVDMTHLEKTDPGTRHVIDLGFITSDVLFDNASGDWRTSFKDKVIKRLDKMFQYSGVNVEFRISFIKPWADFREHLYCDLPTIDNVIWPRTGRHAEGLAISELIPIIRKQHNVDMFVVMTPSYGGGYALIGDGLRHFPVSARWSSTLVMGVSQYLFNMKDHLSDEQIESITTPASDLLAHEIGHVLRTNHDVDTLIAAGASAEDIRTKIYWTNVTTFAYGYGGSSSDEPIGTLMSYARLNQIIPLFSADEQILGSELCDIVDRIGGSKRYGYCNTDDPDLDSLIKLGGSYKYGTFVDASEAMQYTIGVVSEYSDVGAAPLDLSTVSNAITAKAMRTQH